MRNFKSVVVLCVLAAGCASPTPAADGPDPRVKAGERLSDEALQARWWTWAASSADDVNPVVDVTGLHCGIDQRDDLWLVAGTFGRVVGRECEVPLGLPIAGPAVNKFVAERMDCALFMQGAAGSVVLDGVPQELIRIEATPFSFTGKAGNVVTGEARGVRVTGCGLWTWIEPPTAGDHTLVIKGSSGTFRTEAHYRLKVRAAGD